MDVSIPGLLIINGDQGQGKSHLIRYLMYNHRKDFDWGIVFTNTGWKGDNFDYIPDGFVHQNYDPGALKALMNIQKGLIEQDKKPLAFVIFDDCLYDDNWKDPEFNSLMSQLRHYNIFAVISTQYPQDVKARMRTFSFQSAIFSMDGERPLKALFDAYGQRFKSYAEFKAFLYDSTADHCFIFYNKRISSRKIEDRYKVMKCPEKVPKFRIKYTKKM
jgi:hypothetical protein